MPMIDYICNRYIRQNILVIIRVVLKSLFFVHFLKWLIKAIEANLCNVIVKKKCNTYEHCRSKFTVGTK